MKSDTWNQVVLCTLEFESRPWQNFWKQRRNKKLGKKSATLECHSCMLVRCVRSTVGQNLGCRYLIYYISLNCDEINYYPWGPISKSFCKLHVSELYVFPLLLVPVVLIQVVNYKRHRCRVGRLIVTEVIHQVTLVRIPAGQDFFQRAHIRFHHS